RTHIRRRANELLESSEYRLIGQTALRRFSNAEINDFGNRITVMQGHQDIRRLDIAVDNALLMGVLYGAANLHEQLQPFGGGQIMLIAVLRNPDTAHQFHHKEGPTSFG